jgi:zinc protease
MTALFEPSRDIPVVRVQATVGTGSGTDPAGREGVARMTGEMLRRGAGGRTRADLDTALDALGADLGASVDAESVTVVGHVLARNLPPFLSILETVMLRPDFVVDEVEKLRREMRSALDEMRDDDHELCTRFFAHALYGDHAYGRPSGGTEASLQAIRREDLTGLFGRAFVGRNVFFGASGDFDEAQIEGWFGSLMARLGAGAPPDPVALPDPPRPQGRRMLIVDKPERTQAQVLLGHPAVRWGEPDDYPLRIAVTAFGGTFTSPLMTEVRVKRGLSYGAYAQLVHGRGRGHLQGWVFPASAQLVETLGIVLDLWEGLAQGAITDEQVAFAKAHLRGKFPLSIETPERRLSLRAALRVCGLPDDYLATYTARLSAISAEEVRAAARRYVTAGDLLVTVVATADEVRPALERAAPSLRIDAIDVVPFDSF